MTTAEYAELEPLAEVHSSDGERFPLHGLRFGGESERPVVLIASAMGTPGGFYRRLIRELHGAGVTAAVYDFRWQGERAPDGRSCGYRELVDDLRAALAAVRKEFPTSPVVVLGHSLGGQLALLQAAESAAAGDRGPDAVALVASASVYHRAFGLRSPGMLAFGTFMVAYATVRGRWPGFMFGGVQPPGVIRDWAFQSRTGRYRLPPHGESVEERLRELRLPVLSVSVEGDSFAPPRAQAHLCAKVPGAELEHWHYTAELAGTDRLDHFRWARHGGALARRVTEWAGRVTAA
ncbi:alpha/beta fold hydrolase [Streptomyces sp. CA-250714]|uniref:alpha/beta hydrolase family protein n=1 Tax=Streptomyces sp. CA-250714 TaxID=3240060 RepID=UPI003D938ADF